MATFTIQEARAQLADLIHRLTPGEEVVITENNQMIYPREARDNFEGAD